jgi:hypothetical protein
MRGADRRGGKSLDRRKLGSTNLKVTGGRIGLGETGLVPEDMQACYVI